MTKVTLYKTADGKLHETKSAFVAHRAILQMTPDLEAFTASLPEFGGHLGLTPVGLAALIAENADALRKILNSALTVKRAKRAKKPAIPAPSAAAPVA